MAEDNNNAKHDEFFKKVMENTADLKEFLEYYLPAGLKKEVDLSTAKLEKETYVEEGLKKLLSDIVISVKKKDREKVYTYALVEHQSTDDKWIAYRLEKYRLALLERHKTAARKFPLVHAMVIYNGIKPYKAPKSFWELFEEPEKAKEMHGTYTLIDLRSMPDDKIINKGHWGIAEYALKYIKRKDVITLVEEVLNNLSKAILEDKKREYVYLKSILWYSNFKITTEKREVELKNLIRKHFNKEEEEEIMRSVAQRYIDEGKEQGIEHEKIEITKNLLSQGVKVEIISKATSLSKSEIEKIRAGTLRIK